RSCATGARAGRRCSRLWVNFFFFQAEDGIRDFHVTGVQTCALPISVGGPIALVRDGDVISIDAKNGTIKVRLTAAELKERRKQWTGPRETIYGSGALWKYAQQVGAAQQGAVTHPGGKGERHSYPDR